LINGTSGTASVASGVTLKAIAYGGNYSDSFIASGAYTTATKGNRVHRMQGSPWISALLAGQLESRYSELYAPTQVFVL
jgi:hypothetical protein